MPNNQVVMLDNCYIMLNGTDISPQEMSKVSSVEVDCTPEIPSMCVVTFYDEGTELLNSSSFDVGKPLKISFKSRSAPDKTVAFDGEIVSMEPIFDGNDVLFKVTAYDKLHRMNKGTRSRVFASVSDSDIINKLVGEAGLSIEIDSISGTREHVFQDNVSDLTFITYVAHRNGMWVKINPTQGKVQVKKNTTTDSGVTLLRGENMRFFRPRLSSAQQLAKVEVKSWDPKTKQPVVGVAQSSTVQPSVGYSTSSTSLVTSAFSITPKSFEFQPDSRTIEQAKASAQARLDEAISQFIIADGCCDGDPRLMPNTRVEIKNLGQRFSGKYIVTRVIHRYTADEGYVCDFTVEGGVASTIGTLTMAVKTPDAQVWSGVYPAIVTNNNDPDKLGRIKVKYPWLDDTLESDWARIVSSGAGPLQGILNLPEVNDEVLVAFEGGNFNFPYAIGGLWNGRDKVPLHPVANSKVTERLWKTRTGHELHFYEDDSTSKVELKEKNGLHLVLDGTNNKVEIRDKNGQNTIVIDGNSGKITVKAATDVEVSTTNIKLSATGSIKIDAVGAVEIKGATVKVN